VPDSTASTPDAVASASAAAASTVSALGAVASTSAAVVSTASTSDAVGSTSAVSAAAARVVLVAVVDEPLDLAAHESAVADVRAGAVVSFQGVVRDHDGGRGVTLLEYEGHPTAEKILREVADEIAADPAVYAVAVSHRIGTLQIGDVALVASVSTAHRAAAFAACAKLVDEAKARLPIWKRQVFKDGTEEWVNCP
jgi:molybdopterin synthase catalytic subunit